MKISKYFDDHEFFKIDTYQDVLKSKAQPGWLISRKLLQKLDAIREFFGKPVIINRGFSTLGENVACKGAKWSMHLLGGAADIHIDGVLSQAIGKYLTETFSDGAYGLIDANSVHVDVRNNDFLLEIKYPG